MLKNIPGNTKNIVGITKKPIGQYLKTYWAILINNSWRRNRFRLVKWEILNDLEQMVKGAKYKIYNNNKNIMSYLLCI